MLSPRQARSADHYRDGLPDTAGCHGGPEHHSDCFEHAPLHAAISFKWTIRSDWAQKIRHKHKYLQMIRRR
jgi:hypothetical protein